MSTILEINSVRKTYYSAKKELTVLDEIHFTVAPGETCAIIGPSGSGKTTLLGLCAGLDTPTAGTVTLDGFPLHQLDEDGRAKVRNEHIGFVFQNFQLLPNLTALENVMIPAELLGRTDAENDARLWLERVGLGERLGHYPVQLSGGEQQRVAMARAFINKPKILFADEPTGNLDLETSLKIEDLMFELNRASGTALVIVTHNLELASLTQHRVYLRGGKIVKEERNAA